VRSTNPSVVEVLTPSVPLSSSMRIGVRARAVGQASLEVTAPAGWVNRAQRMTVEVR
jgi:hypothetical protein